VKYSICLCNKTDFSFLTHNPYSSGTGHMLSKVKANIKSDYSQITPSRVKSTELRLSTEHHKNDSRYQHLRRGNNAFYSTIPHGHRRIQINLKMSRSLCDYARSMSISWSSHGNSFCHITANQLARCDHVTSTWCSQPIRKVWWTPDT
jgi:hypothetical protein